MVKTSFAVFLIVIALSAGGIGSGPAWAQDAAAATSSTSRKPGEADGPRSPAGPVAEPPFMKPLADLSEILGSMQFLRSLCDAGDPDLWRNKMQALIEAQQPTDSETRRLIASFNAGYRAYESTYRKCTPAARVAVNRYRDQGARLAREIATRYGN